MKLHFVMAMSFFQISKVEILIVVIFSQEYHQFLCSTFSNPFSLLYILCKLFLSLLCQTIEIVSLSFPASVFQTTVLSTLLLECSLPRGTPQIAKRLSVTSLLHIHFSLQRSSSSIVLLLTTFECLIPCLFPF